MYVDIYIYIYIHKTHAYISGHIHVELRIVLPSEPLTLVMIRIDEEH